MISDYLEDTGCEYAPQCLACHLPRCKHDNGLSRLGLADKHGAEIRQLHFRMGISAADLAERFGVSTRTISRIIRGE